MICVATRKSMNAPGITPRFDFADHRNIPRLSDCADIVFAAWTINVMLAECDEESRDIALDDLVSEAFRLMKPGGIGAFLVPETSPLTGYHRRLSSVHGFRSTQVEYEWMFRKRNDARKVLTFFLGQHTWQEYKPKWPAKFHKKAVLLWCKIPV